MQCAESGRVSYKRTQQDTVQLFIPVEAATNKDEVDSYKVRVGKCGEASFGQCWALTSTGVYIDCSSLLRWRPTRMRWTATRFVWASARRVWAASVGV